MKPYFIIDAHCDTVEKIADKQADIRENSGSHVTIDGLRQGRVGLQFFAAWVGPKASYGPSLTRCLHLVDTFYQMMDACHDTFIQVLTYSDMTKVTASGKIGALLTVEGGDALEGDLMHLRTLHRLGVRAMTLTWNHRNEIADGVREKHSQGGLSDFGCQVVSEMNRLGMLIDVSHLSEKSFWDVLEASDQPVAATHSNAKAVWGHPRNLTDQQITALAARGGWMGINFYPPFLAEHKANLDDILRHIEHAAAVAGVGVLGFGADFDGIDQVPEGINGPQGYNSIIEALLRLNYTEEQVYQIACGNMMRLMERILV